MNTPTTQSEFVAEVTKELNKLSEDISKQIYYLASATALGLDGTAHSAAKDNLSRQFNEKFRTALTQAHNAGQQVGFEKGKREGMRLIHTPPLQ